MSKKHRIKSRNQWRKIGENPVKSRSEKEAEVCYRDNKIFKCFNTILVNNNVFISQSKCTIVGLYIN